jgi:hypothetical protein
MRLKLYDESSEIASEATGGDFNITQRVELSSSSKFEPALDRNRSIADVMFCISFAAADAALSSHAKNKSLESTALLEEAMFEAEVPTSVLV